MKWLLIAATVWYWWRLYSLSFNPTMFPDQAYAHRVWDRRSTGSFFLGAAIITMLLYVFNVTHVWWILGLGFAIGIPIMGLVQTALVGLIILNRTRLVMSRNKTGEAARRSLLAPFAWTYYLTEEEKRKASAEGKGTTV